MTAVHKNYINGTFQETEGWFDNVNPADPRDVIGHFPNSGPEQAQQAVRAAHRALPAWRRLGPIERADLIVQLASHLETRSDEIAAAITREQGKPLSESKGEVGKTLEYLRYYAGLAYEHGGRILPSRRPHTSIEVRHEPVGVAALITPWNVPLAIPARKLAPALVAGCTVVLKPARETPISAQFLAEAADDLGFPPGVFNLVHGAGASVGEPLATAEEVDAISFTGSTEVGNRLSAIAGRRRIRAQLELGGKNASVVLEDADLELAVSHVIQAGFSTTGQQCTATSRVLVHRSVLDRFTQMLVEGAAALSVGSGDQPDVVVGPLISQAHLQAVCSYVEAGRDEGAEVLTGGEPLERAGWFLPPTIFGNVTPEMRIASEEIFGPVLGITPIDSYDEALNIVNATDYGLSASIFTNDLSRARSFVNDAVVGAVAVNLPSAGWEVQVPFGGFKDSGNTGWKEQGAEALDFFSQIKAVQVQAGSP